MRNHEKISIAGDLPIYFCDLHWAVAARHHEDTNGLLRQ
jgi:IS30 family transposase